MTAKVKKIVLDNLKAIEHIEVIADQTINFIAGNNGSGKTTLIESIFQAISLKRYDKDGNARKFIKQWEKEWKIFIELQRGDDLITVERTFEEEWTGIKITSNGVKVWSTFVQDRIGNFTIDPLAFSRMRPQEQIDVLKQIAGINTDDLDAKVKFTTESRTAINRQERELRAIIEKYTKDDAPVERKSLSEIIDRKNKIMSHNNMCDQLQNELSMSENKKKDLIYEWVKISDEIKRLQELLEINAHNVNWMMQKIAEVWSQIDDLWGKKDFAPIDIEIANIEEHNEKAIAREKRKEKIQEHETFVQRSVDIERKVEELRKAKLALFLGAGIPIEWLSFDDEGFMLINGIPFGHLSSAEQIKISTLLATHDHPELKVLYIKDGALLDDNTLQIVCSICKDRDYQLFIELVWERTDVENVVIMRNGKTV